MTRKAIPKKVEEQVLLNCRRRCALCFFYEFDFTIKKGQIAHLDKNNSNNDITNLMFLCLKHHDEYDSKQSQSKNFTKEELMRCSKDLYDFLDNIKDELLPQIKINSNADEEIKFYLSERKKPQQVSTEIYNLRIPIYHAYYELVAKILRDATIEYNDLFKFLKMTDEAIFLYDEKFANYLNLIYKKGVHLHYLSTVIDSPNVSDQQNRSSNIQEKTELLLWFTENFNQTKKIFKQYLNLK